MICENVCNYKEVNMKSILIFTLIVSSSLAYVAKNKKPKRISEQKCEEYSQHSSFVTNEYQTFNCSLRYHELVRIDRIGFNPAEFRHLAKIYREDNSEKELICNGALISEQYVVTTAQCVKLVPKLVRLGDNDKKTIQDFTIAQTILHPKFNIALLKLDRAVEFSAQNVLPACLHTIPDVQEHESVFLAGWGIRNIDKKEDYDVDDETSPQECGYEFDLLENADASKVFCTQSQLCEWMQLKTGAPVQIERKDIWCMHDLVGINVLEKGFTCADKSDVNLNIKIYEFLDWIESNVWPDLKTLHVEEQK